MNDMLHISVSPHIHNKRSTAGIMGDVLIALAPAAVAGTVIFGWRALLVLAVSVLSCVAFEALFNLILKKEQTVGDLSAAVTGLILGLNLYANTPIWQIVIGALFAMIIVKGLFGGLGCNLVNPAATARVFMLVSFGSMAKTAMPVIVDTVSSATPLTVIKDGGSVELSTLLLGTVGGSIGETCKIALILGFVYLLVRKVITWHAPVAYVGFAFLFSFLFNSFDLMTALQLTLSGSLLFGAIFMATDYVTGPCTPLGRAVFGFGAALITVLIRSFGSYPEGVSFAILLMNILTPYIDTWTKRKLFGRVKA